MRVLYVGQIGHGQTCRDRMIALRDLRHEINGFDTTAYLTAGPRWRRSLAHRINVGERLRRMNQDLLAWSQSIGRADIVWIDKGKWVFPSTVMMMRRYSGGLIVHYTPDAQLMSNRSSHFVSSIKLFDVIITTKHFEVESYHRHGARRVLLTGQAYDERRVADVHANSQYSSEVCFIGHSEPWYREILQSIAQLGDVNLRIWGAGWMRRRFTRRLPVHGDGLYGNDYVAALQAATIGLGLLQKSIPETSTTRSFEIPACGTFLLAERTDEHQRFFEEGKEADFFSSPHELIDKVHFYLKNERVRNAVAAAGCRRCRDSGYGNRARLARMISWIVGSDHVFSDQRFGMRTEGSERLAP